MMITKAIIRQTMSDAHHDIEACWDILTLLKESQVSEDWAAQVLNFQPRLASTLFRLDKLYVSLRQERKLLLSRRKNVTRRWFDQRLNSIENYCRALKEVMSLCRALGDSFACFFYDNSKEHLFKHIEHEPIPHTPPGDGGIGELGFIQNIKHINGQMIIYHGTTTFLRLGDISLVDLKTLTVTAIGEIKSKRISSNKFQIRLPFLGVLTLLAAPGAHAQNLIVSRGITGWRRHNPI